MRSIGMGRLVVAAALVAAFVTAFHTRRKHELARPPRPHAQVPTPIQNPVNMTPQSADLTWEVAPRLSRDLFEPVPVPTTRRAARPRPALDVSASEPEVRVRPPQVQILLLDPRRPLALVDNRRVAVGDSVSGYRVVAIEPDGVTFERRGERFTARP